MSDVQTTTTVTSSAVGSAALLKYVFMCLAAKAILMPDDSTLMIMGGALVPLIHMLSLGLRAWFTKKTGIDPTAASTGYLKAADIKHGP